MLKLPMSSSLGLMNQNRALALLTSTVLAVAVLGGLYWAQSVLIPLALGILFTTIATPVVRYIERSGLTRIPTVVIVTVVTAAAMIGLTWLIYAQVTQLIVDLPEHQENIIAKIDAVKEMTRSPSRANFERLLGNLKRSIDDQTTTSPPASVATPASAAGDGIWFPVAAVIGALIGQVLGYAALASVVAIFLLVDREEFRNRLVQLVGRGQITQTTKALDDAARRISRFLLMQALINSSYGVVLAIGLYALGVKYAILWGVLAAVLRYIPYIGGTIATVFPVTLSLAQFPSWWPALVIVGMVLVQEIIVNNFVEPKLFGQSIGVSSVALIVAATFWTFLWGPVGLIMAGPLTVCLAVLGKYVPRLGFLNVLLGDRVPLDQEVVLYQRLLAKDELETERIMADALAKLSLAEVYDTLVFPAAASAGRYGDHELLPRSDEQYIYTELEVIMANNAAPLTAPTSAEEESPVRLLLVAARDRGDRLGVVALAGTLNPQKYHVVRAADNLMGAEVVALVEREQFDGICISSLPPGGLSHTKYLCKRLRARQPQLKIFVGHWSGETTEKNGWSEVEADVVAHSLQTMLQQLDAWKPVLEASGETIARTDDNASTPASPHFDASFAETKLRAVAPGS